MREIDRFHYSWNGPAGPHLREVEIEDDTLRDGLQGAFVRRPAVAEKIELLGIAASIGVQFAMLGFPSSSRQEFADCAALVAAIQERGWRVVPRFLARAEARDLEPIVRLGQDAGCAVWADFFVGVSPLRRHVEGWNLDELLRKIAVACEFLRRYDTPFGVSIEDATRTPRADLERVLAVSVGGGADWITICDTVGDVVPDGAARLVAHARERLQEAGRRIRVAWHGHNDKGLALANALAAAEAGAHIVSGAFLGIGERTGNTSLEQVIMYLHQAGSERYRLERIVEYCRKLAAYTETPIPSNAPLVGTQTFATCTGTHTAAILKARALGVDFEDAVFSGVPAQTLGRRQEIAIGPTSGLANARFVLSEIGMAVTDENAAHLLDYAKRRDRYLTPDEVRRVFVGEAMGGRA